MLTLTGLEMPLKSKNIEEIMPHSYPMLMLDNVINLEPGKFGKAIKNVTGNDHYLRGHFPSNPIMPGVWTLESMFQLAYLVELASLSKNEYSRYFTKRAFKLTKAKDIKFRQMIIPGDSLQIYVEKIESQQSIDYKCIVFSDSKKTSEAILTLERIFLEV